MNEREGLAGHWSVKEWMDELAQRQATGFVSSVLLPYAVEAGGRGAAPVDIASFIAGYACALASWSGPRAALKSLTVDRLQKAFEDVQAGTHDPRALEALGSLCQAFHGL